MTMGTVTVTVTMPIDTVVFPLRNMQTDHPALSSDIDGKRLSCSLTLSIRLSQTCFPCLPHLIGTSDKPDWQTRETRLTQTEGYRDS